MSTTSARLSWEFGASLGLHAGLLGIVILAQQLTPAQPLFKPADVMVLNAVALPKAITDWLPDKPMHTPEPITGETPDPAEIVPPTASDMVLKDDKAPETQGQKSHEKAR